MLLQLYQPSVIFPAVKTSAAFTEARPTWSSLVWSLSIILKYRLKVDKSQRVCSFLSQLHFFFTKLHSVRQLFCLHIRAPFYFYDFSIFSFCTYSFKLHNMINLNKYLQYLEIEFVDIVTDKNIEFFIPIGIKAISNIVSFQQSSRSYLTNNIGVGQIESAVSIWQVVGRLYMDFESSMEKWFIS